MNRVIFRYLSLLTISCCVLAGSSWLRRAESQEMEALFNGRDLDGWINVNCAPETWQVRDEMIICSGKPTGVLRTEKQYQNYILELEWKHLKERGNAGLFLHSDAITAVGKPFTRSIEVQIMDGNHGDIFSIHGATLVPARPHPRGSRRALPSEKRANPAGQWNHYRVESRDGIITLAVNGKAVSQAVNANPRKGYICLESEGSEVHFRNIKIRELPADPAPPEVTAAVDEGFRSLYNGLDFRGWRNVPGNEGHWRVKDWRIEYDGRSEAQGDDRSLWTLEEFQDFVLIVDWRQPRDPQLDSVPVILPDGSYAENPDGSRLTVSVMDAGDSGIYLRGSTKSQINIWNWPVGSGEIWGYRLDEAASDEVHRRATPIFNADSAPGEWNRFVIRVVGETVSVELNGRTVIREARLPGLPARGPIGLQHHGDPMEFANIYLKRL